MYTHVYSGFKRVRARIDQCNDPVFAGCKNNSHAPINTFSYLNNEIPPLFKKEKKILPNQYNTDHDGE